MASFSSRALADCSSSPTSPRPACRSSPATRRRHDVGDVASGRTASTTRRSPARRCRRRTSPVRRCCSRHCTRLDAGRDQVGADDDGDHRGASRRTTTTPADPFDFGAGRVDLDRRRHGTDRLRRDSPTNMTELGNDPVTAMNVNIPSINVPTMPGTRDASTRTATNVTNKAYNYVVNVTSPDGGTIKVVPQLRQDQGRGRRRSSRSRSRRTHRAASTSARSTSTRRPASRPVHLPGGLLQPAGRRDAGPEVHADDASPRARRRRAPSRRRTSRSATPPSSLRARSPTS